MSFKFEVRDGAFTDRDINGVRSARKVGLVYDFTPTNAATALDQAAQHAQANGAPYEGQGYPNDTSGCVCTSFRTLSTGGANFVCLIDYERPQNATFRAAMNTLYVVHEQRTTVTVTRSRLPHVNDGNPLVLGWVDPALASNKVAPQLVQLQVTKPALEVVLAGRFNQRPTYLDGTTHKIIGNAQGTVNDDTWMGFARGYWLFAGAESTREPGQPTRTVRFTLMNLLDQDWSDYLNPYHPSGEVVNPAASQFAALDAGDGGYPTEAEKYIRPAIASWVTNGIARVGPYPVLEFDKVFASLDNT